MKSIQAATYLVHFQEIAYQKLNDLIRKEAYSTIFILVDENTFTHCYPKFIPNLNTDRNIEVIEIESGEINKNIETCVGVWNAITELGGDRKSLLITLGGGVITDLGGFVASTFKRGIDFVNIPTTLLSMVDAAVGGKTGVDLGVLKNQIGLFSNPEMVLIDTAYLTTVTDREMKSGMAEVIKYGLTYDLRLFNHIKQHKGLNVSDLIFRSIAIGMVCESYISSIQLGFSSQQVSEIKETVLAIYGKTTLLKEDYTSIIDLLKHDKKNENGQVNFVLIKDFEKHQLDCKVSEELIVESLNFYNS